MKKLISTLLALTMLFFAIPAFAGGESVSMTFEDETYHLAFAGAELVDGALNVCVSGFGNAMHIRNGKVVIPFWVHAVSGGQTYPSSSVSCGSEGEYTYTVACDFIPEEIYIYAYDDEEHPVLLWQSIGAPEKETTIPDELVGTWHGTGTPVGKGSAISLEIAVNADGSGAYTFEQAGYVESYPFSLASDGSRFSVSIPADNTLGIVSCEGSYTFQESILSLHIITSFAGGGQYEYNADCTKDDTYTGSDAPEFCGAWQLTSLAFLTPDPDNGIFSIDASISGLQGSQYGDRLELNADGAMLSDIDLNSLIGVIPQLPFSAPALCLSDYSTWAYAQDALTLSPGSTVFTLVYDGSAAQLSLTHSTTVEIQSTTTDVGTTKGGPVDIEITVVLQPAQAQETPQE